MGRRKCAGCQHAVNDSPYPKYWNKWRCGLPSGGKVCQYNKEKIQNFFTPKVVSP